MGLLAALVRKDFTSHVSSVANQGIDIHGMLEGARRMDESTRIPDVNSCPCLWVPPKFIRVALSFTTHSFFFYGFRRAFWRSLYYLADKRKPCSPSCSGVVLGHRRQRIKGSASCTIKGSAYYKELGSIGELVVAAVSIWSRRYSIYSNGLQEKDAGF